MNKDTTSCLRLCKLMMEKKYGKLTQPVHDVFKQFQGFFKTHQMLEATYEIDPSNLNGTFWKYRDRVIADFLVSDKEDEENHRLRPILVKSEVPKEVFDALKILTDGMKKAIEGFKIEYYGLSFHVLLAKLPYWVSPIEYFVVNKNEDARALSMKIRTANAQEHKSGTLPSASPEEIASVQTFQPGQPQPVPQPINDPTRSDSFGLVNGGVDDD